MQTNSGAFGGIAAATLNPDDLADTLWRLYRDGLSAEAVVNALAG